MVAKQQRGHHTFETKVTDLVLDKHLREYSHHLAFPTFALLKHLKYEGRTPGLSSFIAVNSGTWADGPKHPS